MRPHKLRSSMNLNRQNIEFHGALNKIAEISVVCSKKLSRQIYGRKWIIFQTN
jgi:hypothetical protein